MKNLFIENQIEIDNEKLEKFDEYYKILIEYNSRFNITSITEKEEVYKKHFIDSLKFHELFNCGKLIDVGSGGGFPALPLKIMNDNLDITMVEATGKKCEYLSYLVEKLNLKNVKILNKRAEELAFDIDFREKFDYASARAVARLNILTEYLLPFLKIGGKMVAYKSVDDVELNESKFAIKTLGGKLLNVIDKDCFDMKRRAVVIEKTEKTDKKYPRSNAKIRKNPLI